MFSHSHKETACTWGPNSVCLCERYRVWVKLDANTHGIYYLADGRFSSVCCMMLHLPCAIGLKLKAISISSYRILFCAFLCLSLLHLLPPYICTAPYPASHLHFTPVSKKDKTSLFFLLLLWLGSFHFVRCSSKRRRDTHYNITVLILRSVASVFMALFSKPYKKSYYYYW